MTDKLSLYNGALTRHLGESKLANLTEDVAKRHALDVVWDADAVDTCLQAGQWDFGARTQAIEYDPSIDPSLNGQGFQYAFERPSDLRRIMAVCQDAYLRQPLTTYDYSGGYWFADITPIYVKFVSNDVQYGGDFSLWPPNFTRYVECYLAKETAKRIKGFDRDALMDIRNDCKMLLSDAKATDAMERPSVKPPLGSWSRARLSGGRSSRWDGTTG
jgi:hypothetical protein